jgi:hypothetical protein
MGIREQLKEHREKILNRWFESILKTYPAETVRFLKNTKDQFHNPVGQTIKEGIEGIFLELTGEGEIERITPFLDRIIRIRAIQDFTLSEAVAFIFQLKGIIRQEIDVNKIDSDELAALDRKIDELGLRTFDIYMGCREKIYELKATELRNWTYKLLERANLLKEFEDNFKSK